MKKNTDVHATPGNDAINASMIIFSCPADGMSLKIFNCLNTLNMRKTRIDAKKLKLAMHDKTTMVMSKIFQARASPIKKDFW